MLWPSELRWLKSSLKYYEEKMSLKNILIIVKL